MKEYKVATMDDDCGIVIGVCPEKDYEGWYYLGDSKSKLFHTSKFMLQTGCREVIATIGKDMREQGIALIVTKEEEEYIYVLLADGDGTMRSKDEPFGVAVKTKEAAEEYIKNGGVGYTHSYSKLRIFDNAKDGIDWVYRKIEPVTQKKELPKAVVETLKYVLGVIALRDDTDWIKNPEQGGFDVSIIEKTLQSLQREELPKAVVLRTEIVSDDNNYGTGQSFHNNRKEVVKVNPDNTITDVKFIY